MTTQPYNIKIKILETGSCPHPEKAYIIVTKLEPKI